jgi:hypothetical protein
MSLQYKNFLSDIRQGYFFIQKALTLFINDMIGNHPLNSDISSPKQ